MRYSKKKKNPKSEEIIGEEAQEGWMEASSARLMDPISLTTFTWL
jgi:hypothetical protein